ncbi:MAG TPA: DUF2141 domain-containing protein [Stellaceae bacterium]|nr:DUF2141 domain-containing protein [Stellaceae bacterium]
MKLPRALLATAAVCVALGAGTAHAAKIVVTIDGLHSAKGDLYVALFSRADEFPDGDHSDQHVKLKASLAPITVTFDALRGRYAVGAYHDENANGKLDTNFIGYPTEGYALSNGIRAVVSRPRFTDAAFLVGEGATKVALHIKY